MKRNLNEQSLTEHKKPPRHITFEMQTLAWARHKNVALSVIEELFITNLIKSVSIICSPYISGI